MLCLILHEKHNIIPTLLIRLKKWFATESITYWGENYFWFQTYWWLLMIPLNTFTELQQHCHVGQGSLLNMPKYNLIMKWWLYNVLNDLLLKLLVIFVFWRGGNYCKTYGFKTTTILIYITICRALRWLIILFVFTQQYLADSWSDLENLKSPHLYV